MLQPHQTRLLKTFIILVQPTERLLTVYYRPITVPAFYYQFTANIHWFSSSDFARQSPLLRPTTTPSTTSLQPTNQVAACFPSWFHHFTRQHSLFVLWDGGTLCVPCPDKSYTVLHSQPGGCQASTSVRI
ncbi:hypothetical protein TNCV_155831 [Trichonephila clavipes]|nr:hypothetical protein TNCV_155831 [Trichonephila clavipes]